MVVVGDGGHYDGQWWLTVRVLRTVLDAASPFDGCEKDAPQSMMLKPTSNTETYTYVFLTTIKR